MSEERRPIDDYVLGELDSAEASAARERLEPAERERADDLREISRMLGDLPAEAWALLDTPAREDLRAASGGAPAEAGEAAGAGAGATVDLGARREARRRVRGGSVRPALAIAAALLVLALGIGIGALIAGGSSSPSGRSVALAPMGTALDATPANDGRGTARMLPGGRMRLTVSHMKPTGPGSYYELWLMNSARDLVPVASFHVTNSGRADLEVPLPVPPAGYHYIDVSLQRAAEGLGHSGDSVLRAPIPS